MDALTIAQLFPDQRHSSGGNALRSAQLIELRILKIIDHICIHHQLRYWLDGGTLLGAVRHEGFIPWDDDIDIVMPRPDYVRFLDLASTLLPPDLELELIDQSAETATSYAVPSKIRDKHSKITEARLDSQADDQKGLFVDIIPIDVFHDSRTGLIFDRLLKWTFRNLSKINDARKPGQSPLHVIAHAILLKVAGTRAPSAPIRGFKSLLHRHTIPKRATTAKGDYVGYGFDVHWTRIFLVKDIYPLRRMNFEGSQFLTPHNPDGVLKIFYGPNYMSLPPVSQQKPKHLISVIIDTRIGETPFKLEDEALKAFKISKTGQAQ